MAWGCQAGIKLSTSQREGPTRINPTEVHATIKLGIDAHAKWFYVGRQLDGDSDVAG